MIDTRLLIWNAVLITYLLLFPAIRNFYSKKKFLKHVIRNILVTAIIDGVLYFLFISGTAFKFSEFQFLILFINGFYMYSTYPATVIVSKSSSLDGTSIQDEVMKKLARALHGTMIEDDFTSDTTLRLRNPYQITFSVTPIKEAETFYFEISSSLPKLFMLLHLGGLYLITSSLQINSLNPFGTEFIPIPLIGEKISAVVGVIATIIISGIFLAIEVQSSSTIAVEIPLLYKRFLKKLALEKLKKKETPQAEGDVSELEKARERAREILEKRNTDVLNRKREEIRNKVDDIFNKDTPPMDDDTLKRFKLMKTIERILQSTPPWAKVKLSDIADLAGGSEEEVELIIAGLRQSGDAPGFYDIWTKTYIGSKQSQWYITELLREILSDDGAMNIDYIKILPDGTAEIGVEKQSRK